MDKGIDSTFQGAMVETIKVVMYTYPYFDLYSSLPGLPPNGPITARITFGSFRISINSFSLGIGTSSTSCKKT